MYIFIYIYGMMIMRMGCGTSNPRPLPYLHPVTFRWWRRSLCCVNTRPGRDVLHPPTCRRRGEPYLVEEVERHKQVIERPESARL